MYALKLKIEHPNNKKINLDVSKILKLDNEANNKGRLLDAYDTDVIKLE